MVPPSGRLPFCSRKRPSKDDEAGFALRRKVPYLLKGFPLDEQVSSYTTRDDSPPGMG